MNLTDAQLADLRSAGASLDAKDMEIADALGRRGFSGDDLVAAYREHNALKSTYPEFGRFGRELVETIAVAHKLGLDENDKYWLVWYRHDQNLSLTDAYNTRVMGGPGLRTAGWIMSGVGVALVIVGALLYNDGAPGYDYNKCQTDSKYCHVVSDEGWAGLGLAIGGGVLVAIGVPSLIVGYVHMSHWAPPGSLDTAPADSIRSLRASDSGAREPAIRWAVTPLLGPNQAGLGLRAVF